MTRSITAVSWALVSLMRAHALRSGSARFARYCLSACIGATFASIVLASLRDPCLDSS